MCKVIAIANQKGGVGKTTTTGNLGIGLVKQGKKVLVIDADPQGSLTASLGFQEPDKIEVTLASVMGKIINDEEVEVNEGILHHEEGVDIMPGNIELSGLEVSLVNVMSRERILQEYVNIVKDSYDFILIVEEAAPPKTTRHKYGLYKNVLLSDEDYQKLQQEFPHDYTERIERLSEYIASTGKKYKNHLATIRTWARKDTAYKAGSNAKNSNPFLDMVGDGYE